MYIKNILYFSYNKNILTTLCNFKGVNINYQSLEEITIIRGVFKFKRDSIHISQSKYFTPIKCITIFFLSSNTKTFVDKVCSYDQQVWCHKYSCIAYFETAILNAKKHWTKIFNFQIHHFSTKTEFLRNVMMSIHQNDIYFIFLWHF